MKGLSRLTRVFCYKTLSDPRVFAAAYLLYSVSSQLFHGVCFAVISSINIHLDISLLFIPSTFAKINVHVAWMEPSHWPSG